MYIYAYCFLHLHILGNAQRFDLAHIPGSQMAKIRNVYPPSLSPGQALRCGAVSGDCSAEDEEAASSTALKMKRETDLSTCQ